MFLSLFNIAGDNDGEDRSHRNFILRQPRLKISNLSSSSGNGSNGVSDSTDIPLGLFSFTSSSSSSNNRLPFIHDSSATNSLLFKPFGGVAGVTTTASAGINALSGLTTACDICKVQTTSASQISKKFSAHNCEACRKFISKMLKKSSTSAAVSPLACVRGDGGCDISADKGKDRCSACLLKSCLRNYNLPLKFRLKLHLLLPQAMKIADKAQLDGFHKRIKNSSMSLTATVPAAAAATSTTAVVGVTATSPTPLSGSTGTTTNSVSHESNNLFSAAVHSTTNKILVDKDTVGDDTMTATSTITVPFKGIGTKSVSLPNPLAENNLKFGSQPPIKPNVVIDKPIILSPKVLKEAIDNEQVSC